MTPDLLARYDQTIPRYTSYPTAPHFTPAVDGERVARWFAKLPAATEASLYLHVPFCAELCLYCGCHTTVTRRYGPVSSYVDLLAREIDLVADRLPWVFTARHIHWGGGTPTILAGSDFEGLMRRLRERFAVAPDAEIAVEIDPRTIAPAGIEALARAGVNRASLGVQSFDPRVQQAIRRLQSPAQTRRVAEWLRFSGIEGLNLDLMYGLPHQSVANVVATVDTALDLDPDRVSLFGYAHVPWMKKHQALLPEEALPGVEERYAQATAAAARIVEAGYVRVGLDHFAKPEDALARALDGGALHRNFQGYTTDRAPALIGFGTSAISSLPQGYAQNAASTVEYRNAIAAGRLATARGIALTFDDRVRGEVIERLMCGLDVDLAEICREHGLDKSYFDGDIARVDRLAGDGLVRREGLRVAVPEAARPFVRTVCAAFDRHLAGAPGRHARAV